MRKAARQLAATPPARANELDLLNTLRPSLIAAVCASLAADAATADMAEAAATTPRAAKAAEAQRDRLDDLVRALHVVGMHSRAETQHDAIAKLAFALMELGTKAPQVAGDIDAQSAFEAAIDKRLTPAWAALSVVANVAGYRLLDMFGHELQSDVQAVIRGEVVA